MAQPNETNDNTTAPVEDLMGYEGTTAVVTPTQETKALDTQTLINDAIKEVTVGEDGKIVYPDNMDPMLRAAVAASKSFRDTQSGFHKNQQSLKETEAENVLLREQLAENTRKPLELTPERQKELDDLMYIDPNAWRVEMNKLEQQSTLAANEKLDTVTKEARGKASAEYQLEQRVNTLEDFNSQRETPITVDILDNDIPKRINDKLANGEVSFSEYLEAVSTYLETGKVVAQSTPTTTADLNSANGSTSAPVSAQASQQAVDYSQMTF